MNALELFRRLRKELINEGFRTEKATELASQLTLSQSIMDAGSGMADIGPAIAAIKYEVCNRV